MEKIEEIIDKLEDNIRWWKRAMETDGFESDEEGSYRRDLENTKKELFNLISDELDGAREEGYEQCKKDFIENFCDVADRPLVISKSAVKEMFRVLEYGKNLWADNLKTKEDEK